MAWWTTNNNNNNINNNIIYGNIICYLAWPGLARQHDTWEGWIRSELHDILPHQWPSIPLSTARRRSFGGFKAKLLLQCQLGHTSIWRRGLNLTPAHPVFLFPSSLFLFFLQCTLVYLFLPLKSNLNCPFCFHLNGFYIHKKRWKNVLGVRGTGSHRQATREHAFNICSTERQVKYNLTLTNYQVIVVQISSQNVGKNSSFLVLLVFNCSLLLRSCNCLLLISFVIDLIIYLCPVLFFWILGYKEHFFVNVTSHSLYFPHFPSSFCPKFGLQ